MPTPQNLPPSLPFRVWSGIVPEAPTRLPVMPILWKEWVTTRAVLIEQDCENQWLKHPFWIEITQRPEFWFGPREEWILGEDEAKAQGWTLVPRDDGFLFAWRLPATGRLISGG